MAYTKIHAVKATIAKAVNYICDPAKTDGKILIDSFGTGPETAAFDFQSSLSKTRMDDPNLAYHLIQSFAPGEVSYEEAHQIGRELADRLLKGKHSYVLATHIDHNHVHNHIIFCAADNMEHKKYHDCRASYYQIRHLSDELCEEHDLSIISAGNKRGMKYNEWACKKDGTAWKEQLKKDINACILAARGYDHFLSLLAAKGYEIKGAELKQNAAKYIAFRPLDGARFVRGSERSFGSGFTKEEIKERIDERIRKEDKKKIPFPVRNTLMEDKPVIKTYTKSVDDFIKEMKKDPLKEPRTSLIDTSSGKMATSMGLYKWASLQNLKTAASAYASLKDLSSVDAEIQEKKEIAKTSKASLVSLEKKMIPAFEILHYAEVYKENLRYLNALKRSKDPDRYFREHEDKLHLFYASEHVLIDRYGIDPDKMDLPSMRKKFALMQEKKAALSASYKQAEKEAADLIAKLTAINEFLKVNEREAELTNNAKQEKLTPDKQDKDISIASAKDDTEKDNHL